MIRELLRKTATGLRHPEEIPPWVNLRLRLARNRNRITDWYEPDGNPDYRALMLTSNVYRSFLPDAELSKRTNTWMNAKGIPKVLNRLGFSVDVYNAQTTPSRSLLGGRLSLDPDSLDDYDLVIGAGENYMRYRSEMDDDAVAIYAPGSPYWLQYVQNYLTRIDNLQRRKKRQYTDYRGGIASINPEPVVSDGILALADELTRRHYAESFPDVSVRKMRVSHPPSSDFDVSIRDYETARKRFVYYAGNGPVLKGIDLALEAFADMEDVELYVVGPQNKPAYSQFADIYDEELNRTDNIHNVGWVEMFSEEYYDVIEKCGYLVYASAADGYPGAVVSMMWHGVIPILSEESISDLDEKSILLPDTDIETIRETVAEAAARSPDEVHDFAQRVYEFARETYARETVCDDFEAELEALLTDTGFYENR